MKVCFFGLGSIGKRHAGNLSRICRERGRDLQIDAFRQQGDPLPEALAGEVVPVTDPAGLQDDYDVIFITNPTHMHRKTLMENMDRGGAFFIEKPVFERAYDIQLPPGKISYVACPLRYTQVMQYVQELNKSQRFLSAVATSSSYLPHWRPGSDYRRSYSAHRAEGGGVHIDLIHEMDYICHLFGAPNAVHLEKGKLSQLEIDSDDLAVYQLRYPDKIALIYLDYFGVFPQRSLVLRGEKSTVTADLLTHTVSEYTLKGECRSQSWQEDPNDKYIREMECFLDCLERKCDSPNDIYEANRTLALAFGEKI